MSQLAQWNTGAIKQLKKETGQALLRDESTLVFFSQDFGKLSQSSPVAVSIPQNTEELHTLIQFAEQNHLPLTIRGKGMSQSGQSLAISGGLTLSMQNFNKPLALEENSIWVQANTSWKELLALSLPQNLAPFVLPYNCNLPVAGVLSVGGIGASSFKYGAANAYVIAMEVIDGCGLKQVIDANSPLFHACLAGQGQFAVITKVCLRLRKVLPQVKSFALVYNSLESWFEDIAQIKDKADHLELFCSPSIQGARLKDGARTPMAQWLYGLNLTIEYENKAPELTTLLKNLNPWQVLNLQEEPIGSYFLRHDFRFEAMHVLGQWDLLHPWYECFISEHLLKKYLPELLQELPLHFANMIHVVPVAKHTGGFLMLPEEETIYSLMILHPGIHPVLRKSCVQVIQDLDNCFIPQGGKRYLSGFLGETLTEAYWSTHFNKHYSSWLNLKNEFDPHGIFTSRLFNGK